MRTPPGSHPDRRHRFPAFTLVELLVAMTITTILLTLLVQMLGTTQQTWQRTRSQAESFRDARAAFESISRQLAQATLNNYWDYNDPNNPTFYQRQSELHYVSGPSSTLLAPSTDRPASGHAVFFQAPLGVDHLDLAADPGAGLDQALNAWGYFVEYNSDLPTRPEFMEAPTPVNPEKKRFRLMEFRLPAENFNLFKMPASAPVGTRPELHAANNVTNLYSWFRTPLHARSEPLAENILTLVIRPVFPAETVLPSEYLYDTRSFQLGGGNISTADAATRHQLPPTVQITLVALDEASWARLDQSDTVAQETIALVNNLFKQPTKHEDDLHTLTSRLTELKLDHRVFSTTVPIRSAKWHTEKQKNPVSSP